LQEFFRSNLILERHGCSLILLVLMILGDSSGEQSYSGRHKQVDFFKYFLPVSFHP